MAKKRKRRTTVRQRPQKHRRVARYQVMPPLSEAEYAELKRSIKARGVLVPVEYDEIGEVLDGHHRVRACTELGITDWPRVVRQGLSAAGKRSHARKLNLARRHLTQEQKRALIADQLRETPERSDRAISADIGVDHKTVGAARAAGEATGEIPHTPARTGRDRKTRRTVGRRSKSSSGRKDDPVAEAIQADPLAILKRAWDMASDNERAAFDSWRARRVPVVIEGEINPPTPALPAPTASADPGS